MNVHGHLWIFMAKFSWEIEGIPARYVQETATLDHECDMLMHGQSVTQRHSEVVYISQ